MRRLLVILMLGLLPFQFVWGAVAGYCQHEQGAGVVHFGHHVHKHQGKAFKASGEATPDTKGIAGDGDPDCATCHLTVASPLMNTAAWLCSKLAGPTPAPPGVVQSPHIPNVIERPNWSLAV